MPSLLTAADLRGLPLFAQLTDTQADRLLAGQIGLDVAAEQVLLLQQDEGEGLLVIQTGLAKVRAYTANGEEAVMAVLGPGDLMGEMAVLRAGVRNADVVALSPWPWPACWRHASRPSTAVFCCGVAMQAPACWPRCWIWPSPAPAVTIPLP